MSDLMKVGSDWGGGGTFKPLTSSISGAQRTSDAHGRFTVAALEGRLYSGGMTVTSISNATFAGLTATATPVAGVWNPATSNKNLVVLQAVLGVTVTAATATGCGPFVWATSVGNTAISTGNQPLNRATLQKSGSVAKDMAGVALTGLTNNLVIMLGSALCGGNLKNISSVETAVGQNIGVTGVSFENIDGSFIVPPGGILALLTTATAVGHSAASGLLWEEVPILAVA